MQVLARLREISEEPWAPVSSVGFALASSAFLLVLYLSSTGDRWVWILDNANLAFHEAGHPIAGLVNERLAVYGGTVGQLVFPLATTAIFWARRHALSFALCGLWLMQNLFNISVYMADARALVLPLVGGLDPESFHDWREIFGRWGLLAWDTTIGFSVRVIAWIGALAIWAWLTRAWWRDRDAVS